MMLYKCVCCGSLETARQPVAPVDSLCYSCRVRSCLCLHNMSAHYPYRHSSRPHVEGQPCPVGLNGNVCVVPEEGVNPWRVAPPQGLPADLPPSAQ